MWKRFKDHHYKVILLVQICITIFLCGCSREEELYPLGHSEQSKQEADKKVVGKEESVNEGVEETVPAVIYVHVCGAVNTPGVVQIPSGSRTQAAVDAAGGFSQEADTTYVNLAAPIEDGAQLYIPTGQEAKEWRQNQAAAQGGRINLNTADARLLCTLPGIGESRALDIIAYRQKNGDFKKTEEIKKVPGIKDSIYEKIKDLVIVN